MHITQSSPPPLSPNQLNNLLNGKLDVASLDLLTKSASQGNLDDIDLLHNLALRDDELGQKAENILFDLFSGKTPAQKGIDREIQKTSEKLYQLYSEGKIKRYYDGSKLTAPSKLLYIIGSITEKCIDKLSLTKIFINDEPPNSTLWDLNRMITSNEIDSVNNNTEALPANVTVNCAMGLTQNGDNLLAEIIQEKMKNGSCLEQFELFPINVNNNHWILVTLYSPTTSPSEHKLKCHIFNSYYRVTPDIREEITLAAQRAGVTEEDITYIEGNIQQNVPNGCGLFVLEAIKQITKAPEKDLVKNLYEFQQNFSKKTIEEQEQFNLESRRQLFSHYLDDHSS